MHNRTVYQQPDYYSGPDQVRRTSIIFHVSEEELSIIIDILHDNELAS